MNIKEKILSMTSAEALELVNTDEATIWWCDWADVSVNDVAFDYWLDEALDHAEMILAGDETYAMRVCLP